MPAHNSAQKEKKSSGPASKAGGKVMGRKDKRAEACNWENIEEFIGLLQARVIVTGLTTARVVRALGAGRCEIQYMNGETDNLPIAGSIRVKNSRKVHLEACMSAGNVVLINGGQITATLSAGHCSRVERLYRTIQEQGRWAPSPAGGSIVIPSEFTGRIDTETRIAFPPSFFGAAAAADDEEAWEFDRDAEEAQSGVARLRKGAVAEGAVAEGAVAEGAEGAEDEVNMDDL
jgi:hypothetical protein